MFEINLGTHQEDTFLPNAKYIFYLNLKRNQTIKHNIIIY